MQFFMHYTWPGNVRELENILERAAVLAEGQTITLADLPQELLYNTEPTPIGTPKATPTPPDTSLTAQADQLEASLIQAALEKHHWNKSKAADALGIKRTTLQYKIKKFGLE
jgi:DNA-binding NtrC family response regulator